jgi:hypothetical protein
MFSRVFVCVFKQRKNFVNHFRNALLRGHYDGLSLGRNLLKIHLGQPKVTHDSMLLPPNIKTKRSVQTIHYGA